MPKSVKYGQEALRWENFYKSNPRPEAGNRTPTRTAGRHAGRAGHARCRPVAAAGQGERGRGGPAVRKAGTPPRGRSRKASDGAACGASVKRAREDSAPQSCRSNINRLSVRSPRDQHIGPGAIWKETAPCQAPHGADPGRCGKGV